MKSQVISIVKKLMRPQPAELINCETNPTVWLLYRMQALNPNGEKNPQPGILLCLLLCKNINNNIEKTD